MPARLPHGESLRNILFTSRKCRGEAQGHTWELTKQQFKELTQQPCYYCGAPPSRLFRHKPYDYGIYYNGVDRVDNGAGYVLSNCVPCCWHCNRAKGTMTLDEFMDWVSQVYHYNATRR